jgi:NAD(P)H-dependent FMN reductase
MKVVAFNGSPRRSSNTAMLLEAVIAELKQADIKTELVQLGRQEDPRLRRLLQVLREEGRPLRRRG